MSDAGFNIDSDTRLSSRIDAGSGASTGNFVSGGSSFSPWPDQGRSRPSRQELKQNFQLKMMGFVFLGFAILAYVQVGRYKKKGR